MTHVATAVIEVTSAVQNSSTVVKKRPSEYKHQNLSKNSTTMANNGWNVTRRIESQRRDSTEQVSNVTPVKRTPTFTPHTKLVNGNIRSRVEIFENNKENMNGFNVTVKTSQRKLQRTEMTSNQTLEPETIVLDRNNTHENSEIKMKISEKKSTINNGRQDTVVIVKDVLAKWEMSRGQENHKTIEVKKEGVSEKLYPKIGGEETKRYRTVDVPIRPPAINIAVRPWTSSGQFVTDSDSKEVERILAQRRKLIEESTKEEPKPVSEVNDSKVEFRPISLEPWDEMLRESSGASLDVSFPKALDLARHQQRPLWRDIRGIKEKGILDNLTKEGRIRQEAKFELMLSEGSFLHSLNILKGHYMNNIHKHIPQVISEKDYDILFKHALDVRACSEAFLEALDAIWQTDPMLNGVYDVVRTHAGEQFGAYVRYCRNILDMSNHLAQLISGNEAFRNLLEVLINREGSSRLTLDAFLTAPMQRITKLPLLMKTILDKLEEGSDEFNKCTAAYEATTKIATECDEVVNEKKRLEELLRLSQELEFAEDTKSIPIMAPQRAIISRANVKHFAFRDKAPKREKLQLILLSDLLLVTKRKSDKLFIVVDHCSRDRAHLKEMENPTLYGQGESTKQLKPVVVTMLANSQDKKLDLVVTFKEQTQCKEWLQMFATNEEEEDMVQVIALQEHEPSGAEELTLSPGDVVQVMGPEVNGWCEGEIISDGTKGRFPIAKTTKITSSRVKAANLKAKKEMRSSKNIEETFLSERTESNPASSKTEDNRISARAEDKATSLTEDNALISVKNEGSTSDIKTKVEENDPNPQIGTSENNNVQEASEGA